MKYRILNFHNENIFEISLSQSAYSYSRLEELSNLSIDEAQAVCRLLASFFDFMPTHVRGRHLHQLPAFIWKRKDCFPEEITFYGGSFHPWHQGHDACVRLFPHPESLLVLPDNNPWKSETRQTCPWTFFKDLALRYQHLDMSFYPGFLGTNDKNPTVSWLTVTTIQNKSLLLGDDTFQGLSRWYNIEELLKHLKKIYVVPRKMNVENYEDGLEFLHKEAPHIEVIRLPRHPFEHISSTEIRNIKVPRP